MAEIVNLRIARKARKRADKETQAAANRAKFGQTKAQKDANRIERDRTVRSLDGARREQD